MAGLSLENNVTGLEQMVTILLPYSVHCAAL